MARNDLRPCPFCGDRNAVFADESTLSLVHGWVLEGWIECESCGARGPRAGDDEVMPEEDLKRQAINDWNERG